MNKIAIIFNKNAGSFRELSADPQTLIDDILLHNNATASPIVVKVVESREISSTVEQLISEHYDIVAAAGGDGTINSIATLLKDSEISLGVVPMGTYNHLAKDANIPLNFESAILNLINGTITKIDYGTVNDKVFLNNSSLGHYPISVVERDKVTIRGKFHKKLQMALSLLKTTIKFPLLDIQTDKHKHSEPIKTPFIFIGNNHYSISPSVMGQRKGIMDGKLSAYMSTCTNVPCVITLIWLMLTNTLSLSKKFQSVYFTEATISAKKEMISVAIDGEVYELSTPLHYKIHPQSLKVILPSPHNRAQEATPPKL